MKRTNVLAAVLLLFLAYSHAQAGKWFRDDVECINQRLAGRLIDHTHNHGADKRIWSNALQQCRDLYVYVPPGFDPRQRYPLIMWLHGFGQDEQSFMDHVVERLDRAIIAGKLPPVIIAAPDGSITGEPNFRNAGSFFLNSRAGKFEDFLMRDVWKFVLDNYPIRPEREAHVIAGVSMGGAAAFNKAIKYRDRFKTVVGIFPPLNMRWLDCHGCYMSNFDPCCWDWRTDFSNDREVIGRFYGVVAIRLSKVIDPLYDRHDPGTVEAISRENVIEMLERCNVKEGELNMCVAYGGKDQFNINAQVESFLQVSRGAA